MNTTKSILVALGFVVATGVIGSVVSPVNIVSILGFCSVVVVSLLGMIKANETSDKVAEVKVDLAKTSEDQAVKLDKIEETGDKVHTLVNSNMGVQLKLTSVAMARIAELTKDPMDIRAADLARSLLHEHEKKQAVVDGKENKPEDPKTWDFLPQMP